VPMKDLKGRAFIIYFSWEGSGQPQATLLPSLVRGLQGLIFTLHWDTKAFQVRWQRIGKLIR
jgi:hypothetical protein